VPENSAYSFAFRRDVSRRTRSDPFVLLTPRQNAQTLTRGRSPRAPTITIAVFETFDLVWGDDRGQSGT
jgi:hypothetical protein